MKKVLDIFIKLAKSNVDAVFKEGYRIMARDARLSKLVEAANSQVKTWRQFRMEQL